MQQRLANSSKGENALKFWSNHAKQLPIIARIALRILCVPVTSSQVERLFSASGRICTFDRARLKPANVDILTSLHVWYSIDLLDKTTAAKQRTAKGHRFCWVSNIVQQYFWYISALIARDQSHQKHVVCCVLSHHYTEHRQPLI